MLVAERLREVVDYNPATGQFIWRKVTHPKIKPGSVAGTKDRRGYHHIKIDGGKYRAARLAWLWMTGTWPPAFIDHKNKDKSCDAWENLRSANRTQNNANRGSKPGRALPKGVQRTRTGGYRVIIRKTYDTPEEAGAMYAQLAALLFGEFASC